MKLKYIKEPDLIADLQKGWKIYDNGLKIIIENTLGYNKFEYDSLEDFNREWETIKEPLLKGDFRLAIKVWLDYCNAKPDDRVHYYELSESSRLRLYTKNKEGNADSYCIELERKLANLKDVEGYTVQQLIGE